MAENTEYPIGNSKEYIKNVKGLYARSIGIRNEMLSNNPLTRRYADHAESYSMVDAPDIGEEYILPNPKKSEKEFWDKFGGLVGYTYNEGYLETNNYNVISRFEDVQRHQGYLRFRLPYLYNIDIPVDINREFFDYNFLNRLYGYCIPFRSINIYGNSESFGEFNPIRHTVNKYNPDEGRTYVTPKSKNVNYSINEETFYPDGKSIDTPSYSNEVGGISIKHHNNRLDWLNGAVTTVIGVYNEPDGNEKVNVNSIENENLPANTITEQFTSESGGTLESGKGLLYKTNKLFEQGKIHSLVNRFHSEKIIPGETDSAYNSKYGFSRGRNLTKINNTSHGGYENPYCRVWTSHYQYSKYKNAIRPFVEDDNVLSPPSFDDKFGEGFRPFKIKGHRTMSSIDESNGLPIIAPMGEDNDIRRCMFSIENLAWKDVHFNTRVIDRDNGINRGFDNVLSKEQQGPNGGRIMWFPPYNLKFNENVGVNWNGNSFIGRGEQIYTYVNTDRSGTLDFTLLIDHPSILDRYTVNKDSPTEENDEDILRFFAGCGMLDIDNKVGSESATTSTVPPTVADEPSSEPIPEEMIVDLQRRLYAFFPNNFSGEDYQDNPDVAITYLLNGGDTGYEISSPIATCIDSETKTAKNKNGGYNTWYYEADDWKKDEVLKTKTTYSGGTYGTNYKDASCFKLNTNELVSILTGNTSDSKKAKDYLRLNDLDNEEIAEQLIAFSDIRNLRNKFNVETSNDIMVNALDEAEKIRIRCVGFASKHGDQIPEGNQRLAINRARILQNFLIKECKFDINWFEEPTVEGYNMQVDNDSVSSIEAKLGRHAAVFIDIAYKYNTEPEVERTESATTIVRENKDVENQRLRPVEQSAIMNEYSASTEDEEVQPEYDTEYRYFKRVNIEDDVVKRLITDKVKYFDPAFHSITPEGFNARLTFLHQCTRQGPTVAASENGAVSAGNLAFGRPPVCVLRIGDFYNTKIIIDSVSINYDANGGTTWDMNTEGIGLQPMYANVTIGFKFLGGSDLSGPIARLQNAVSYNFYANTSVYDRHADYRDSFITNDKTNVDIVNMWEAGFNDKTPAKPDASTAEIENNKD